MSKESKTADGRLTFWLHQPETPHHKDLVHVGFVPKQGEVLTLYLGPRQFTEVEVLGCEGGNLFVRRVHGINHYLHVLHLVAVELYALPNDLRNGLVAELCRALEKGLTEAGPLSKDHCAELMRILQLVREERKLEAPHEPGPRQPTRSADEPADGCPSCGCDDFSPQQVPDGDGGAEHGDPQDATGQG